MKCNLTDATFHPVPWDRFGRERFKREEMLKPTGRKNSCVHVMSLLTSKKDFFFFYLVSAKKCYCTIIKVDKDDSDQSETQSLFGGGGGVSPI